MRTLTLDADQLQQLGTFVLTQIHDRQTLVHRLQEGGREVPPAVATELKQLDGLLRLLNETSNVGGFDPRVALEVLERVAKGSANFLWIRGVGAQEDVEHAVRLRRCEAFTGHVDNHGVAGASALTERGQALLEVLRCWSLPVPVRPPQV